MDQFNIAKVWLSVCLSAAAGHGSQPCLTNNNDDNFVYLRCLLTRSHYSSLRMYVHMYVVLMGT